MSLKEIYNTMKHYFERIMLENTWIKSLGSLPLIFFGSDKLLAFFVILLVIIDFITGVIKSKHLNVKIESSKFRRTILKLYVYYSLILTLGIVDYMTGLNFLIRVGYGFIAITEGKSIIENLIAVYPTLEEIKDKLKWWKSNGNSSKTSQS